MYIYYTVRRNTVSKDFSTKKGYESAQIPQFRWNLERIILEQQGKFAYTVLVSKTFSEPGNVSKMPKNHKD